MKEQKIKIVKFKKGEDCYRCGVSKKSAKKFAIPCNVYGVNYKTHIYK